MSRGIPRTERPRQILSQALGTVLVASFTWKEGENHMRLNRDWLAAVCLAAGALLGYAAATGHISWGSSVHAATPALSPAATAASCCSGSAQDETLALAAHNANVLASTQASGKKPNILCIWGDDIGTWNISHNNRGMMGYKTPNIDRIAREGVAFTDYYAQQSCTAGRAAFISGSVPVRSGMTKVGMPGAKEGWQKTDVTMATVLKSQGYATGQFGKNHQGDRDEHLPTMHGFDEFLGSLYHLNAEEEPENRDYPRDMKLPNGKTFLEQFGPRGVLKTKADGKGGQTIENLGPLTKKRMETI
ncbi:MAG: sulfatase-like hydrolase/transferase, partial [Limisphaerales bacterium]